MSLTLRLAFVFVLATLVAPAGAHGAGEAYVAAVQVGLRAHGLYAGAVDGVTGPATERAVRALQRKKRLPVDGVPGPATRAALGVYGRPRLGTRGLHLGAVGWDVATLQFRLAWRGFPSGALDGRFTARTHRALLRFQAWAGLTADGVVGPATVAALARPPATAPIALAAPVSVAPTDGFGPRGNRFHTGLDFPAPSGTPVGAAGGGRIAFAGWLAGGWGHLVSIAHGSGVRTLYAHLGRVDVRVGQRVAAGDRIGIVGSTGHSTGPHLHFEVRLRGAAIDPLTALARH